ncbi:MAG: zinc-binding dehydrogenase [Chloroflexota bacterium]
MVVANGGDHVIDYTREDFTQNDKRYDLIPAANGYRSISDYRRALSPMGIYVMTGGAMVQLSEVMLKGPWISMTGSQKMGNLLAKLNQQDLSFIKDVIGNNIQAPSRRVYFEQFERPTTTFGTFFLITDKV